MKHTPVMLAALLAMASGSLAAQVPGSQRLQTLISRSTLESLAVEYEAASQSRVYSAGVRERARRDAQQVRARLADGDFHVGDRILLDVRGETVLTDTFTVEPGRAVNLPNIGPIPLTGVLRSELTDYLSQRLQQFLRNPVVRARSLIRVTIMGAVTTQGFYTVPVDIPVDAVLAIASGPATNADLDKISILRGNEILYEGEELQRLITEGVTIDALNIQAGDRFKVEVQPTRNMQSPEQRIRTVQYLLALPLSVYALWKLLGF